MGKKENYLNFPAFRKVLYDGRLSERARLVYIHLLQKSSQKGCKVGYKYNDIEITKSQVAIDLGIFTRDGNPADKSIQRDFAELEAFGYLKRYQKFKKNDAPLIVRLNFDGDFLKKKEQSELQKRGFDVENDTFLSTPIIQPNLNLSKLIQTNPDLSESNHNLSDLNTSNTSWYGSKDNEYELKEAESATSREEIIKTALAVMEEANNFI